MEDRRINGVDVSVIKSAVEDIERRDGLCHPAALVAAAKAKRSPLHPLFTWDDSEAAGNWRTHEARRVINRIEVIRTDTETPMPAFVHVRRVTEDGVQDGYMSTVKALASDHRDAVISDVAKQLAGLRARYKHLTEFQDVWEAVDEAIEMGVAA
jgi:hypothetical protein